MKRIAVLPAFIFAALTLYGAAGCAMDNLFTKTSSDISALLQNPAIQSTLERWAVKSDVSNPRMSFVFGTLAEMRLDGVIVRGDVTGSVGKSGMDPDLLERFLILEERFNAAMPAEVDTVVIEGNDGTP